MSALRALGIGLAALLLVAATGQSSREERKKQKEFDRKVNKALAEFRKTYTKRDVDRIEGLKKLAELKHEKVVIEIGKFAWNDTDLVRKTAIEILAGIRHPKSAEALIKAWDANIENPQLVEVLVQATEKLHWDELTAASLILFEHIFEPSGAWLSPLLGAYRKIRSVTVAEPLLKYAKKMEDQIRNNDLQGGDNTGNIALKNDILETIKVLTGETFDGSKSAQTWFKRNKTTFYSDVIHVYWCPKSWDLWEKKPKEKRKCPHHQDEKKKKNWKEQIIMVKPT